MNFLLLRRSVSHYSLLQTAEIIDNLGTTPGSIGVVDLKIPMLVDPEASILSDFSCGANKADYHFTGVNWERDASATEIVDLRNVIEDSLS